MSKKEKNDNVQKVDNFSNILLAVTLKVRIYIGDVMYGNSTVWVKEQHGVWVQLEIESRVVS
jgi:hypothetical protein